MNPNAVFHPLLLLSLSFLPACTPPEINTPLQQLNSFQLEPGLKIQLVASEPMVQDPVVITFDEDGRLWVVEMRGFMPDIDGTGEREPVGRISILEDTDADGQMDKSTIYLDSLVMPRALAVVSGGALVVESEALWWTEDTDHDLKADTKTLIDPEYAGSELPEHSGNGLWRGLDNWYYNAKSRFRYKLIDRNWLRDSTELRGQWGISHDDEGRLYYNYNWSQLHADLVPPNYLSRNKNHLPTTGIDVGLTLDRRVYPIRANPAVNRGYIPGTLDENGRLLEFTSACSPFYYRSQALPPSYYGNVFVCEPAGNLVKRNVVHEDGVFLQAHDPHPGKEFLASTDERFRPVHAATGPDGALYIADMYRGLIEHGPYITPYLRETTLERKLDQPVHLGRIWRIVPENWEPAGPKKLSAVASDDLLSYLSHDNGWYRDIAQRLLVERNDKSIDSLLQKIILDGVDTKGKLHALWTMEGLGLLEAPFLLECLADKDELIRTTALRLLEPFAKEDEDTRKNLEAKMKSGLDRASMKETLQIALTAGVLEDHSTQQVLLPIILPYDTSALMRDAVMSSLEDQEFSFLQRLTGSKEYQTHSLGKEIFLEMLTTAVLKKSSPKEVSELQAMLNVDENQFDWKEKAMLTAITIKGGNTKAKDVQASLLNERDQQLFAKGRQHYLSTCAGCHGTTGEGINRFAPTLVGSEWVLGSDKRLALLLLHGLEGPIEVKGKLYDAPEILPVMPAHSPLDDGAITAIMTYIRNEWGNNAGPLSRGLVGSTRHRSQGRVMPWTAIELNRHMADTLVSPTQTQ